MKDRFQFKQFTVKQDRTAMKVGTDGVLLGAWATGGSRILDVGTGTGLIALMMAQRFPSAHVDAVEIDDEAYGQAMENMAASPFAERCKVYHSSLQNYQSDEPYDAIVCNPPYFVNALKAPEERRSLARHADSLSFADLLRHSRRLLCQQGKLNVVLPTDGLNAFMEECYLTGFFLERQCDIRTTPRKKPKRVMLTLALRSPEKLTHTILTLSDENGERSEEYKSLTSEFYLSI